MCHDMLTLRPFAPSDQSRILEILTDTTVNQTYMLPDFENREDAISLFNRLMQLSMDENRYVCCIALNGKAIGFLNDVEIKNGIIELGYVIHPDSQGHGYMTCTLWTAITELFELGYREVICGAFEENKASLRVMEKAGMIQTEKTKQIEYRGKTHRCIYCKIRNQKGVRP